MKTNLSGQTNRLLGYPPDARLLLVNADDFGMCSAISEAIFQTLETGFVRSTSLMLPCAGSGQALDLLRAHPEIAFGVHLTVICDVLKDPFGPLSSPEIVPSLLNEAGHFYDFDGMPQFLARATLPELELEFRAQIEAALAAHLQPTHLDWHAIRFGSRSDIPDLMLGLAKEYGLALRVIGRPAIERLQHLGLPGNDDDFLDSYMLDLTDKPAQLVGRLRELPAGLHEWAVHPGFDNAEMRAVHPDGARVRQSDYDFLMSPLGQTVAKEEGIVLLDYRPLQAVWRERASR